MTHPRTSAPRSLFAAWLAATAVLLCALLSFDCQSNLMVGHEPEGGFGGNSNNSGTGGRGAGGNSGIGGGVRGSGGAGPSGTGGFTEGAGTGGNAASGSGGAGFPPGTGGSPSAGTGGTSSAGTGGASSGSGGRTGGGTGGGISAGTGGRAFGTGGSTGTGGSSAGSGGAGGASGGSCTYNGRTYPVGAQFPASDQCNDPCTCQSNGQVVCLALGCKVPACFVGRGTFLVGSHFPADGNAGCNRCDCSAGTPGARDGVLSCAAMSCGGSQPLADCGVDTTYRYGEANASGFVGDISQLTDTAYERIRPSAGNAVVCEPALPACDDAARIDLLDIMRDLAADDVRLLLAQPIATVFGVDGRPSGGTVFRLDRAGGVGIFVGDPCPSSNTSCIDAPAGVTKLVSDLRALDQQELADPSCSPQ